MDPDKHQATVAALQLLLADVPDDMKRGVLYTAFPQSPMMILLEQPSQGTKDLLRLNHRALDNVAHSLNGESPIGRIAAINLQNEVTACRLRNATIAKLFGLIL